MPRSIRVRTGIVMRLAILGVIFASAFGFGYARQIQAPSALAAEPSAPAAGDPRIAIWHAADDISNRLAPGGSGFVFNATQLQVLRPTPGGPDLLQVADREHPDASPVVVDHITLGALSGRGAATNSAYFAEWFNGVNEDGTPTFQGDVAYAGLMHDGAIWHRDAGTDAAGDGWLESSDLPGFGVDPFSLRELPDLLRRLDGVTDLGTDPDGHHWSGTVDPLWYPGAVAVDGAPFTGGPVQIELWLDSQDRLTTLFAVAQNVNEPVYQLLCVDRVRFDYGATVTIPAAPAPSPEASQP
jgi:hypothetical protein